MFLFILYLLLYLAVIVFICWLYWRKYQLKSPGKPFNYRISDIWAAMLGLSPSMALLAKGLNHLDARHSNDGISYIVMAAFLLPSQIGGLFIGRLDIEIKPGFHQPPTAWESAVSIVAGAIIGPIMVFSILIGMSIAMAAIFH